MLERFWFAVLRETMVTVSLTLTWHHSRWNTSYLPQTKTSCTIFYCIYAGKQLILARCMVCHKMYSEIYATFRRSHHVLLNSSLHLSSPESFSSSPTLLCFERLMTTKVNDRGNYCPLQEPICTLFTRKFDTPTYSTSRYSLRHP